MDKKYRLCYEWRSVLKLVWRRKEKEKKTAMFVELSSCVWSIICQCRFSLEGGFVEAFMAPRAWGGARKQLERILRMEGLYEVVSRTDARDESFLRWSPQRIESSWHQCLGCSICRWWLKSGSCGRLIGEDRLVWGSGCPSSFAAGLLASFQNNIWCERVGSSSRKYSKYFVANRATRAQFELDVGDTMENRSLYQFESLFPSSCASVSIAFCRTCLCDTATVHESTP